MTDLPDRDGPPRARPRPRGEGSGLVKRVGIGSIVLIREPLPYAGEYGMVMGRTPKHLFLVFPHVADAGAYAPALVVARESQLGLQTGRKARELAAFFIECNQVMPREKENEK